MTSIVVIPDTQVIAECNTDHLEALGNYVVSSQPDYIVHIGDHFDMHSLSSYDVGRKAHEGARVIEDIKAGQDALDRFESAIVEYNSIRTAFKKKQYKPNKYFFIGNHEHRIVRHIEAYPVLDGLISFDSLGLKERGWKVYPFLRVMEIEGIQFSHYFVNVDSAKKMPFSSSVDHQLIKLGFSFIQGHRQGFFTASPRYLQDGRVIRGIIAGSFYSHDPDYLGEQGKHYWRGALHLEDVQNGMFRLTELPLNKLLEEWL